VDREFTTLLSKALGMMIVDKSSALAGSKLLEQILVLILLTLGTLFPPDYAAKDERRSVRHNRPIERVERRTVS
jgi:hypothetical protein